MNVSRETLISPAYLREQQMLHADPRGYGAKGGRWAPAVLELARKYRCEDVLDYGCGQADLWNEVQKYGHETDWVQNYDPAVSRYAAPPEPADLVVCTDVLEHVEPEKVQAVLNHLAVLTRKVLLVSIGLLPTSKTLSDGRQAHVSLFGKDFWLEELGHRFEFVGAVATANPAKHLAAILKARR